MYNLTSSSLVKLYNFLIFEALLTCNLFGLWTVVKPSISFSPFLTIDKAKTAISGPTIAPLTDFLFLSPALLGL